MFSIYIYIYIYMPFRSQQRPEFPFGARGPRRGNLFVCSQGGSLLAPSNITRYRSYISKGI